jgi:two-component system, sensor histidine kinase RegB
MGPMIRRVPAGAAPDSDNSTSLRRLLALRWVAIGGQLAGVAATERLLSVALPWGAILLVVGAQALLNGASYLRLAHLRAIADGELFAQLLSDVAALSAVVHFAGGAMNPLITLYLPLIAVAAAILPARPAALIAAASIAGYSVLSTLGNPLHVHDPQSAFQLHLVGMWMTFVFSALIIAWFVVRMTAAIRSRDAALAAAREAALRNERVVALGNLAAGAAHELGTPLATVAVLAGELEHHPGLPADVREDLGLLASQVRECKRIITELAVRAGSSRAEGAQAQSLDAWLGLLARRWRTQRPMVSPRIELAGKQPAPRIAPDATLEQALLNLFNNAADASPGSVDIAAHWDAHRLEVEVADRGPGIPSTIVDRLGREAVTTRADGAGIGLVLAVAAIERSGGALAFTAREGGGTRARITLPLEAMVAP